MCDRALGVGGPEMCLDRLDQLLLAVDGLGGIVVAADLDALLAVALHGVGGQRDDRSDIARLIHDVRVIARNLL